MTEPTISQPELDLEAIERLRQRLGPADEQQIRLLLAVSPGQRLRTMMDLQEIALKTWQHRLRKAHPELDDLSLTLLIFERLHHARPRF